MATGQKSIVALEKHLNDLLKEVMKATPVGAEPKYSLTDKMKIIDRALKLEAIKGKLNDGSWGSGFNDDD